MYLITSITLATAAFIVALANALPASSATTAGTLSLKFSNATTGDSGPICGANALDLTLGPAQLNKCVSLGNKYTLFQIEAVGSGIRDNCIFTANEGCSKPVSGDLSLVEPPLTLCLGNLVPFTEIMYTSDCPTGTGG